jgi:hypothetical protein
MSAIGATGGMGRRVFVIGGLGTVALLGLQVLQATVALPTAQVDTDNHHSLVRHGLDQVRTVRTAMQAQATRNPQWFNRKPCRDGRFRFVLKLAGGGWAVWVLEQVGPMAFREVTAFVTQWQDYAKGVSDHCGNDDWFGHSFAQVTNAAKVGKRAV